MAQVSQSKFKSWIFHKALSSKEADLKKFVSMTTGFLISRAVFIRVSKSDRPFPSYSVPLFQNESLYKTSHIA